MPVNNTIQLRKGSSSEWLAVNPILANGEPGFDTSNSILKIGDGTNTWTDLPLTSASEIYAYVKNSTSNTLYKGQVVYINGSDGSNPTIELAIASNETSSSKTLGLLKQNLSVGEFGYVVTEGILDDINTDAATSTGDSMWLSPTVSGGILYGLSNKPVAPNHMVFLGYVLRKQLNNGKIYVKVQNGYELDELHNVAVTGATNGQFLQYNSISGLWLPSSSGNFTTLQVNGSGVLVQHPAISAASSSNNSGRVYIQDILLDTNGHITGIATATETVVDTYVSSASFNTSNGVLTLTKSDASTVTVDIDGRFVDGNGTSNYLSKWTDTDTLSNSILYDNGTNIGIGTTSPARNIDISSSAGTSVGFKLNSTAAGGRSYSFFSTNNTSSLGSGRFGMYDDTAQASRMVIDSVGNIGIGTNNPSYKIDVVGTGHFDALNINGAFTFPTSDGFANQYLKTDGAGNVSWASVPGGGSTIDGSGVSNYITKWTDSDTLTSGIIYDDGTNVGIGTPSPEAHLTVVGDALNTYTWIGDGTNSESASLSIRSDEGSVSLYQLGGSSNGYTQLEVTIDTDTSQSFNIGTQSNNDVMFFVDATELVRFDSSTQRVGIGTSSPAYKLDVVGTGNFSQNILVNGTGVSLSGHIHTISIGTGDVSQLSFNTDQVLNIVGSGGINISFNDATNTLTVSPPTAVTGYEELTSNKTTFNVSPNYRVGTLSVYYNGFRLINGRDFTATNGTSFVLSETAVIGDVVEWVGTT